MSLCSSQQQEKQTIDFILDDKRTPATPEDGRFPMIVDTSDPTSNRLSNYQQYIHHYGKPASQESLVDTRPPPTPTELQYIKRIHTLMTLVAKQTKEIQSLRSIIEAYSQNELNYTESHSCCGNDSCNISRKRNKH